MAYYIDPATHRVFVSDPGPGTEHLVLIDRSVARRLNLKHDQLLTSKAIRVLVGPNGMPPVSKAPESAASTTTTEVPSSSHAEVATFDQVEVPSSVRRASNAAGTVEGFAWLVLLACVAGGLALALQTSHDFNDNVAHPYIGVGLGVAIGGSINCLMIIMVAAYIKAKMELARIGR